MSIDFSLIQAQPTPKQGVMGSIPGMTVNNGPNKLDSLASGLLEGAKVGTQIAATRQDIAASKQKNAEEAALFPSILQQQKNAAETSNIDLESRKVQAANAAGAAAAFRQNMDAGMAYLQKNDVVKYLDIKTKQINTEKSIADLASKVADTKTKQLNYSNSITSNAYDLAQAASKAGQQRGPQAAEAVYQQGLKFMGDTVASALPPHFDDSTYHVLSDLGGQSKINQQRDQIMKNGTPEEKNAYRTAELQNKIKSGIASDQDKTELNSLQNQIQDAQNAKIKKQGSPSDYYDKALAGQDAKTAASANSTRGTMQHLAYDASDGADVLSKVPAGYTGPVIDYLKANKMNTEVQKLQKILAEIPFLVKSTVGISNGMRFTQGELEQLNKASGSTAINREALQWVLDRTNTKATEGIYTNWKVENDIRKNGSPEVYKRWLESNPEPKQSIDVNNSYKQVDFTKGKIYTDKNGMKAIYTGDPKNPWQETK